MFRFPFFDLFVQMILLEQFWLFIGFLIILYPWKVAVSRCIYLLWISSIYFILIVEIKPTRCWQLVVRGSNECVHYCMCSSSNQMYMYN